MNRQLLEQIKDVSNGVIRNNAIVAGYRINVQKSGSFTGRDLTTNKSFNGTISNGAITKFSYGGVTLISNGRYTLAGEKQIGL